MREALLAAGARQFARRGVATVSVEEIIAEADVSRATFYDIFSSKYKLLEELLNPIFDIAISAVRDQAPHPPLAALEGLIEIYLQLWTVHREGLLLIPAVDSEAFRHLASRHAALNAAMLGLLTKAEHADLLRNGSAVYSLKVIARTAIPLLRVYDGHVGAASLFRDAMTRLLVKGH